MKDKNTNNLKLKIIAVLFAFSIYINNTFFLIFGRFVLNPTQMFDNIFGSKVSGKHSLISHTYFTCFF